MHEYLLTKAEEIINMSEKTEAKTTVYIKWFHSFGLAYWKDTYDPVWHPVVRKTYNIVFLFVRIQISYIGSINNK